VNCHIHAGSNAPHVFLLDHTKADYFGSNFIAYYARRRGAPPPPTLDAANVEQKYGLWAAIRGGATTILDAGGPGPDALVATAGALGARLYLGVGYRSSTYVFDEQGRIAWDSDPPGAGFAGLERAVAFQRQFDGAHDGRIRTMLQPAQLDTCTVELLQATRRAADATGMRIALHAAMNLVEFHKILREHGKTPIELLRDIDFLGPDVILGHCVFHNRHSWAHYPYADDLQIIADSGASVGHAPYKYAKQGIMLESLSRYRERGINVGLGTDTYPEDLIAEMRLAGLMNRFADGSFRVGAPHDVFDCATLGGARALGRDDLGRLAPGAKADLLVISLSGTHFGAVRDPIKSLVDGGSQQDIETIVVDGRTLLADRQPQVVDEAALLRDLQRAGEHLWDTLPQRHWRGATADEMVPLSYPVRPPDR
jgi:5-methylthioadenosine/S-adenosylhomocysteine deaminase